MTLVYPYLLSEKVAAGERAQKMGVNSGAIVREMSKLVGGGGGGKPGIAQGGGTEVEMIEEALKRGVEMVREMVENQINK